MAIFLKTISVAHLWKFFGISREVGVKHDFLCINIWWAPKVALKPESVKQGFSEPPGSYKMFMLI